MSIVKPNPAVTQASSRVKLGSLPQVLPWPYLACGTDGMIRYANRHLARMLAVEGSALAGQPLAQWFALDDGNGGNLTDTLAKVLPSRAWHGRVTYQTGGDRVA